MMKYDECRFINFLGEGVGQRDMKINLCGRVKNGKRSFSGMYCKPRGVPLSFFFEGGLGVCVCVCIYIYRIHAAKYVLYRWMVFTRDCLYECPTRKRL